jgi:hypothetical protein
MVTELGGLVFEITHDLVGDLFRAKNAGVTVARHAGARGEARLAVRWHPLESEGEEEEQGRLPVGSHLAVREDEGIGWRA